MDVLSDMLRVIRLTGAIFFSARLSAPWSLQSPSSEGYAQLLNLQADCLTLFHTIVGGGCWFRVAGQAAFQVQEGDVVIFPHADAHLSGSQPQMLPRADVTQDVLNFIKAVQPDAGIPRFEIIRGSEDAHFVCGYLHCDRRFNPLSSSLPSVLLVRRAPSSNGTSTLPAECVLPTTAGDWLDITRAYMIEEAAGERPANAAMLTRMTELFFLEVLRRYMQQLPPGQPGWLAALRDPDVGQVLELMHTRPDHPWTVTALAQAVALSRSALAQRFTALIGEPPMHYLLTWRMQLAQSLFDQPNLSIREVAERVGYESEVAFNRAFKRWVGLPPATWRRQGRQKDDGLASDYEAADPAGHAA